LKLSISNLAWGTTPLNEVIPKLSDAGIQGIEIAPTAIWSNLDDISDLEIREFKSYLNSHGLVVSGIQSLLYGHPEFQLFERNCWSDMKKHLQNVFRIGGLLGADVAVFGSPKNRVRGKIDTQTADQMAEIFFKQLIPSLTENGIVLTLEPNAPDYGADYLTTYEDIVSLSSSIKSENVMPQIDTGCLWMVGTNPEHAYSFYKPHHIHLSVPKLEQVPGNFEFDSFMELLHSTNYDGWLVIEMLPSKSHHMVELFDTITWLSKSQERYRNA
jgi:sugar phosphate isomerase/epimerase